MIGGTSQVVLLLQKTNVTQEENMYRSLLFEVHRQLYTYLFMIMFSLWGGGRHCFWIGPYLCQILCGSYLKNGLTDFVQIFSDAY